MGEGWGFVKREILTAEGGEDAEGEGNCELGMVKEWDGGLSELCLWGFG